MRYTVGTICLLITLSFLANARAATNLVPAIITTNTTLSGTNLVSGTVIITNDVTVTITPGTQMLLNTNAILIVRGRLLADGTSNAPIRFTRATTAARWSRMMFIEADDSLFRHCVIEYANSAGDHQDYYPTNCTTGFGVSPRPYHEAIVALASHLDVENCLFTNLFSAGGVREGDAFAIVSDDYQFPGTASATFRSCRFEAIGQGIHTRFSYVLVQNCFFTAKNGDNDDIDLYGESMPVPLILNNTFIGGVEDKVNPTRCSAILMGNVFAGSPDHGVVLRDKGYPVVINNVFSNCAAAAISVQNQNDALVANNTFINCGRGVRMFDHTGRHGVPYCLNPGNGKVTVVNSIFWNMTNGAITMDASAFTPHPRATATYNDIQGGSSSIVTNNANCVIVWGPGNINVDPQFTNGVRLRATSPCIDAGTNAVLLTSSNWTASVTNDFAGTPRPLDGNGAGGAAYDIGAFEFFLASADSNGDGIPDGWSVQYGFNPTASNVATNNADGDSLNNLQEWIADTNPTNAASFFRIQGFSNAFPFSVQFLSSSNREYTLLYTTDFSGWTNVPTQTEIPGNGGVHSLTDSNAAPHQFYKVGVTVP